MKSNRYETGLETSSGVFLHRTGIPDISEYRNSGMKADRTCLYKQFAQIFFIIFIVCYNYSQVLEF